jgi:hypothetical protein
MKKNKISKKIVWVFLFTLVIFLIPFIYALDDNSVNPWYVNGAVECSSDGYHWSDTTDILNQIITDTMGSDGCYNPFGTSAQTCCPSGYECNMSSCIAIGPNLVCNCNYTGVTQCSEITSPDQCNNATLMIATTTANLAGVTCGVDTNAWIDSLGNSCVNTTACSCLWDATNGCSGHYEKNETCTNMPPSSIETCDIFTTFDDQCNTTGFMFENLTAYSSASPPTLTYCQNITNKPISCDELIKLDFFGNIQFILAIIALIVIYLIYVFYKKRKDKKFSGKKKR